MPKAAFPLSKNSSFRLGTGWDWCVHVVDCAGQAMRLLIAFNAGKQEYLAWLAIDTGNDLGLIARLEYHASHLGWHVHLKPNDLAKLSYGVVKQSGEKLKACGKGVPPVTGKGQATALAFSLFQVEPEPWGMA